MAIFPVMFNACSQSVNPYLFNTCSGNFEFKAMLCQICELNYTAIYVENAIS